MATVWVNVPSKEAAGGPKPELAGIDYQRYQGNRLAASPRFVVRVTASDAALAELLAEGGVSELSPAAARDILNEQANCTIDEHSALFDGGDQTHS